MWSELDWGDQVAVVVGVLVVAPVLYILIVWGLA